LPTPANAVVQMTGVFISRSDDGNKKEGERIAD
jgi:hypothetical protein